MSKRIDPPPKQELERLYNDERRTTQSISIEYNCSRTLVVKWMHEYGMAFRKTRRYKTMYGPKTQFLVSQKDELSRLYHSEGGGTLAGIGRLYGVSDSTIAKVFRICDIPYDQRQPGKTKCDIIREHTDKYKDDPDSLSPEFLQKMLGVRCNRR